MVANDGYITTVSGQPITPSSVGISGTSTSLTGGSLDLGPGTSDELTAAMVTTLTGGGSADALHSHAAQAAGGGVCYTAWNTTACGAGFTAAYTGYGIVNGKTTNGAGLYCFAGTRPSGGSSSNYSWSVTVQNNRYLTLTNGVDCAVCCN